jgi:nucleoside-diphosphate-sugar epimerase
VRVLISGAGGFIGGHLAFELASNGHEVVALLHRTVPAVIEQHICVRMAQADLAVAQQALPAGPFDALIHCAAAIPSKVPDETELMRINREGSRRLFEHAVDSGAKVIVFCSSMAVYGVIVDDLIEPDTPVNAPGTYGRSKLASESELAQLCRAHSSLRALSIRLPGVVGPGSHDNFLSDTMAVLAAGGTATVRNPDALFNNVVHIDDLAVFVEALLATLPCGHQVTTIAATDALRVREVVGLLQTAAGPGAAVHYRQEGHSFLISSDHAQTLGYHAATVRDAVERFAASWNRNV